MAEWWYYTTIQCPGCGAKTEEYDSTAPWCDSGLSGSPLMLRECEECFEERRQVDLAEQELEEREEALGAIPLPEDEF